MYRPGLSALALAAWAVAAAACVAADAGAPDALPDAAMDATPAPESCVQRRERECHRFEWYAAAKMCDAGFLPAEAGGERARPRYTAFQCQFAWWKVSMPYCLARLPERCAAPPPP